MKYSPILKNIHFNNLASILRVPFHSKWWRVNHPQLPYHHLVEQFNKATPLDGDWNIEQVVETFTNLLIGISQASIEDKCPLLYTEQDIEWFISVLDGENHKTIISMLKAWSSAPEEMITPAKAAEMTGMSESHWRKQASSGNLPGSYKKGKQWLLPRTIVQAIH